MPIYKYQSFEDAEKHLDKLLPVDPIDRLVRLQNMLAGILPPNSIKIQRGIFKFKTLEEANRHRQSQE